MLIRIFLAFIGVTFLTFGIWSLLAPADMLHAIGVTIDGANGTFEMRGIFGGVSLGGAGLCLAGAVRPGLRQSALWFLIAYMGGYCLARLGAVAVGDIPTPSTWKFVAFEAVTLVLALIALHKAPAEVTEKHL